MGEDVTFETSLGCSALCFPLGFGLGRLLTAEGCISVVQCQHLLHAGFGDVRLTLWALSSALMD